MNSCQNRSSTRLFLQSVTCCSVGIMADNLTKPQRQKCMSNIHSKDTSPEVLLRNSLWHLGFRYRVNDKNLPGTPDIVLPKYRTVIFVHGCFWHGHKDCRRFTLPKSNIDYWATKIARNQERDQEVWRKLEARGWNVIIVWECEVSKKRLEESVVRVARDLAVNGEQHRQRMIERRKFKEQWIAERKGQKQRISALKAEIREL